MMFYEVLYWFIQRYTSYRDIQGALLQEDRLAFIYWVSRGPLWIGQECDTDKELTLVAVFRVLY